MSIKIDKRIFGLEEEVTTPGKSTVSIKIVAELLCGAYRLLGSDFDRSKMTVNPDNTLLAQSGVYIVAEFYP